MSYCSVIYCRDIVTFDIYRITPVWEVGDKWIRYVHKWYIALLLGNIASGDIASVWDPA